MEPPQSEKPDEKPKKEAVVPQIAKAEDVKTPAGEGNTNTETHTKAAPIETGPAETGSSPEGIPQPVAETMAPETKSVFASLTEKGKGFLRGVYEKIRSSEIVQNIVDRYQVWNNKDHVQWAKEKTERLTQEKTAEEAKIAQSEATANQALEDSQKAKTAMEAAGMTMSAQDEAQHKAEADKYHKEADTARENTFLKEIEIEKVKNKGAEYEQKVMEARAHLDGRLEAKVKTNKELLAEYALGKESLETKLEPCEKQIQDLDGKMEKLKTALETVKSESVKKTLENNISLCEKKKAELARTKQGLENIKNSLAQKIEKIKSANSDLQEKRDAIMGVEKIRLEKASTKPVKSDVMAGGEIMLDYGGGKTIKFASEKFVITDSKGKTEEVALSGAKNEMIRQFDGISTDELRTKGVSEKLIKKIEGLKKTTKAEKEKGSQFIAKDLVAKWNRFPGVGKALELEFTKDENTKEDLRDKDRAKEFLLKKIVSLVPSYGGDTKKLPLGITERADRFFAEEDR